MRELPMFPLGTTVLPGTILPLHVFEPRYVQMLLDVAAGDGTFGSALITRGREAGTDVDQARADVGTLVQLVESERIPEDDSLRFAVVSIATGRLQIDRWLEDDPYPRAMVTDLPEQAAGPEHGVLMGEALTLLADVINLREQLGEPGSRIEDLQDDPAMASFQIAAMAGLGPHDAYLILTENDLARRLELVRRALRDQIEALTFRLGS